MGFFSTKGFFFIIGDSLPMQAEKFTNHEVDSLDAFEGPEKTLRLYFRVSPSSPSDGNGLLQIPRKEWESALDLVKCKVLSVLVHPKVHAYVLSESSLFVYPSHLVLKTCGTTTLIAGLSRLIEIVAHFTPITGIVPAFTASFYSRRSYFKPEKQYHPHGCWSQEVSLLKKYFLSSNFSSHFGVKKDERWHLFAHAPPIEGSNNGNLEDGWLELMMTGLGEDQSSRFHLPPQDGLAGQSLEDSVMSLDSTFSLSSAVGAEPDDDDPGHSLGNVMTHSTDVDNIFRTDRQTIDSFSFTPCGYSCNGILLDEGKYFTIHVTPESGYSYASFETNVMNPDSIESGLTHQEIVERAVQIFNPQKITLVICTPSGKRISIDPNEISESSYTCTSEAEFDVGNANVSQITLQRKDF